jgi:choline dehydrogenase
MPTVVRANTHLTTVMIAEKMADALKQSVKNSQHAQPVG